MALCASKAFAGQGVSARRGSSAVVRAPRVVCAASRPLWLPGTTAPPHLTGKLAGDNGFDPLGLGQDPSRLAW